MIHAWIFFILVLVVVSLIVFICLVSSSSSQRHHLTFRLGLFTVSDFCYSYSGRSPWSVTIQHLQLLISPPRTKHARWVTLSMQGISLTLASSSSSSSNNIPNTTPPSLLARWKQRFVNGWQGIQRGTISKIMLRGLKSGCTVPIQWCVALLSGYVKLQMDNVSLNWLTSKGMHYCLHLTSLNCQSTLFNVVDHETSLPQVYSMKHTQHLFCDKQINVSLVLDQSHLSVMSTLHDDTGEWQSIMQTDSFPLTTAFTFTPNCLTLLGLNVFCGINTLNVFILPLLLQHSHVNNGEKKIRNQDPVVNHQSTDSKKNSFSSGTPNHDKHSKATPSLFKSYQGALEVGELLFVCNSPENSLFHSQLTFADVTLTSSSIAVSTHQEQQTHSLDMTVDSITYTLVDTSSDDEDHTLNLLSTSVLSVQTSIRSSPINQTVMDNTTQLIVTLNNPILAVDIVKRSLLESWISQFSAFSSPQKQQHSSNTNDGVAALLGRSLPSLDMSLVLISPKVHLQHLLPRDNQLALGMQGIFHCTSVRYLLSGEYDSPNTTPPLPSPASSTTSLNVPSSSRRKRSANLIQRIKDPSSSSSSIKSGIVPLSPITSGISDNAVYKMVFWLNIDNMRVDYWQHHQWIPWVASKHLDVAIKAELAPLDTPHTSPLDRVLDVELQTTMDRSMMYLCDGSLEMDPLIYWTALLSPLLSLNSFRDTSSANTTPRFSFKPPLQLYRRCTASFSMLRTKLWMVAMDTKAGTTMQCAPPDGYLDNTPPHDMVTTLDFSMEKLAIDLVNNSNDTAIHDLGSIYVSLNRLALSQQTVSLTHDDPWDSEEDVPTMKVLAWMSRLQVTLSLTSHPKSVVPLLVGVDVKVRKIALRYSLGNHYAVLLVVKALHRLVPTKDGSNSTPLATVDKVKSQVFRFDLHLFLPGEKELYLRADDFATFWRPSPEKNSNSGLFSVTNITLLGISPTTTLFSRDANDDGKKKWEALVELDDFEWVADSLLASSPDGPTMKTETTLRMTKATIRIPYGYVLAPVLENTVNLVKGVRELHGRLLATMDTPYYTYIGPIPRNAPMQLPSVALQCNQVLFRLDDDPFEAKLRQIFRVGQSEQIRRMNLEAEFEKEKVRYQALKSSAGSSYSKRSTTTKPTSISTKTAYSQSIHPDTSNALAEEHIDTARQRLWAIHSDSWVRNIQLYQQKEAAENDQLRQADYRYRCVVECLDAAYDDATNYDDDDDDDARHLSTLFCLDILPLPLHAPLAQLSMNASIITLNQDNGLFPLDETVRFVNTMGDGVPLDSDFSFLIPFCLIWQAGETLVQVRDYPLPLLHIPLQQHSVAWSLCGNYVIADDLGVKEGSRIIPLAIGPRYSIQVVRTASPTKFYSCVDYTISTSALSTLCWSISYQPAIQDIAQVLEGITPAPVDPSAKIGFWDKLRLVVHTRTKVTFSGGGDVAFVAKGTRDPYTLVGGGAGMAKLWRGNVVWYLGYSNPQQEFTQVQSDSYILGVPDLIRGGFLVSPGLGDHPRFLKTAIKLTGGVQMGIGCHLERMCSSGCLICRNDQSCRFLTFKPHYQVVFKSSASVGDEYHDAYAGFRSDFIHLSISITKSPTSDGSSNDTTVNAMHLTPQFVSHFRQWYGLFGGPLSLPIRPGPLFKLLRGPDESPVKFGRHLQSLKYKILIQPMAFGYFCMLDERRDEGTKGVGVDAVGLKANVSHFCVDVHQRRKQQPGTAHSPPLSSSSPSSGASRGEDELYRNKSNWPLHEVEIQLRTVDLRAIYTTNTPFAPNHQAQDDIDFINNDNGSQRWIDPDDFRELGLEVDGSAIAATATALPFAYSPCVDYVKRLDPVWVQRNRHLKNTHACSMGSAKGALDTQLDYLYRRIGVVEEQLVIHQQQLENLEMRLSKHAYNVDLVEEANETISVISKLNSRWHLLSRYIQKISHLATTQGPSSSPFTSSTSADIDEHSLKQWEHMMGRFKERYTIHNPQIIWTSAVHDIVNRWRDYRNHYYIQSYNISSRATQLLRELVEKCTLHEYQQYYGGHQQRSSTSSSSRNDKKNIPHHGLDSHAAQVLLNKLIADRDCHFVVDNETNRQKQQSYTAPSSDSGDGSDNNPKHQLDQIPEGYSSENMTLIDLWNPQVFLQSNTRQDCGILVANERVQVKQFEIIETGNSDVDTCAVKKRTVASVDAVQLFVTKRGTLDKVDLLLDGHFGVNLKHPINDLLSPWIPPEMFLDDYIGHHHTARFRRFGNDSNITGTIQYDRHNPIRSSSAYQSSSSHYQPWDDQCNSTHLHFPNFDFTADPYQYSVLYQVVGDIILFKKEPRHLERTDRLRDITFSIYANGDSPQKTLEDVMDLQTKIRHFSHLYQDYHRQLVIQSACMDTDDSGSVAQLQQRYQSARQHLITYQEALFLLMQSFKQMMDKYQQHGSSNLNDSNNDASSPSSPNSAYDTSDNDYTTTAVSKVKISVKALVWRMLQNDGSPFSQWKLTNTSYVLISNKDQSLCHTLEIDKLLVKNTTPSPVFKQVVGPFLETPPGLSSSTIPDFSRHKMIYGRLVSLKPVGGIPVIQQMEINLFPLRLQLTYDFWRSFVGYLFPPASSAPPSTLAPPLDSLMDTTTQQQMDARNDTSPYSAIHPLDASSTMSQQDGCRFGEAKTSASRSSPSLPTLSTQHRKSSAPTSKRASWILMSGSSLKPPSLRKRSTSDPLDNSEDDVVIMKQRASKNRTFILIKIHSAKHCLSFQGTKNIYDLNNFCFRQPNLEYRNKTWSWYDLLNALKKDFLRAVIKHSPALIKEKLTPSRLQSDPGILGQPPTNDAEISPSSSNMDSKAVLELGIDNWFNHDDDDEDDDGDVDDGGNSIHSELYMLTTYLDDIHPTTSESMGGQTDDDMVSLRSKDVIIESPVSLSDSEVELAGRSDSLFGKTISRLLPFSKRGKQPMKEVTPSTDDDMDELERLQKGKLLFGKLYR